MKTLINKNNPQIRIIAPEITIEEIEAQDGKIDRYYKVLLGYKYINLLEVYWTLVEEEPVDLEKEIKKHTDLFQADIEYPLRLTAIKFYELGIKEQTKKQ